MFQSFWWLLWVNFFNNDDQAPSSCATLKCERSPSCISIHMYILFISGASCQCVCRVKSEVVYYYNHYYSHRFRINQFKIISSNFSAHFCPFSDNKRVRLIEVVEKSVTAPNHGLGCGLWGQFLEPF